MIVFGTSLQLVIPFREKKYISGNFRLQCLQNGKRPEELRGPEQRMKDLNSPCQFVTLIIQIHRFCTLVCELVS